LKYTLKVNSLKRSEVGRCALVQESGAACFPHDFFKFIFFRKN